MLHLVGVRLQAVQDPLHLAEHVIERREGVGKCDALGAGVGNIALVPKRHIVKRHLGVRLHHAGEAANALGGDGVALVGHRRRALLAFLERLLRLDHVGLLEQAHLHGDRLERRRGARERAHHLRMAVAREHLGRKRVRRKTQLLAHVLLDEGVDGRIRTHRARDGARRSNLACLLETRLRALQSPCPAAELHAEGHRLGMDAVGAAHAQRVLELEGAALARLTKLLHVGQDDVDCLGDLVGKRRVSQVAAGHAVVHPTRGLLLALRHIGIDVLGHVGGEGDDVVVGDLLDLVDALDGEVGVVANPLRLFFRDAGFPQLSLRLARQNLDFLPDGELVLKLPDGAHLRTRVAVDHCACSPFPCRSFPFCLSLAYYTPARAG